MKSQDFSMQPNNAGLVCQKLFKTTANVFLSHLKTKRMLRVSFFLSEFISPLTSCRRFNGSPLPTFKIEYWLEEDTEDFKNHSFRYKDECHLSRYIYL